MGRFMIQVGDGWVLLDQIDASLRFLRTLVMEI